MIFEEIIVCCSSLFVLCVVFIPRDPVRSHRLPFDWENKSPCLDSSLLGLVTQSQLRHFIHTHPYEDLQFFTYKGRSNDQSNLPVHV